MNLRVQREDGRIEIIRMVSPVTVSHHVGSELWRMNTGDGMEHYFTLDGFYDGYGKGTAGMSNEDAHEHLEAIEDARRIESAIQAPVLAETEEPLM